MEYKILDGQHRAYSAFIVRGEPKIKAYVVPHKHIFDL